MSWFLRVIVGCDAGRRIPLTESTTLLIGRGEDCGLRLTDPGASRVHCRIVTSAGKAFVEDAASRWGTLVNGKAIETHELRPGDRILVGDTEINVEVDDPAAMTQLPMRQRAVVESPVAPQANRPVSTKSPPRHVNFEALVGQRFLRFRVGSMVARTHSGALFRAFDPGRAAASSTAGERTIALKIFAPESFEDEQEMRRFLRAIRTMLPLEHENLVKLHTAGRWQGLCFASFEFVEGDSVRELIQRIGIAGMLDWRRAWQIAVGVARALEYAHARGIVHRSIRPGHILINDSLSVIKLGDLTLAKAMDGCGERITRPGQIVGNPCYVAPELLTGDHRPDGRADIYSLGLTLYAILTGRHPFSGLSALEMLGDKQAGRLDPPGRIHLGIPPLFEGVVMRMLSPHPEDRYASATELLRELERVRKYADAAL